MGPLILDGPGRQVLSGTGRPGLVSPPCYRKHRVPGRAWKPTEDSDPPVEAIDGDDTDRKAAAMVAQDTTPGDVNPSASAATATVTVHCFFGCPHTEAANPRTGRAEAMEDHYLTAHRTAYSRAVEVLS